MQCAQALLFAKPAVRHQHRVRLTTVLKIKPMPIQTHYCSRGFHEVEDTRFLDSRHLKVVRLSSLRTDRLYPPGNIPGTHFRWRLSRPEVHSAARRITSIKHSNDIIGNLTLNHLRHRVPLHNLWKFSLLCCAISSLHEYTACYNWMCVEEH